jgi:hypothetical protein
MRIRSLFLFAAALGLQGCPAVGPSNLGAPAADIRQEEPASDTTDAAPAEEATARRFIADEVSHTPRGLDTNLPLPVFDPDGCGGDVVCTFYFFYAEKLTYSILTENRLKTELEGFFYAHGHHVPPAPCCEGRNVLIEERDGETTTCTVARLEDNGYLKHAHVSQDSTKTAFGYFFGPDDYAGPWGSVDCASVAHWSRGLIAMKTYAARDACRTDSTPQDPDAPTAPDYCAPPAAERTSAPQPLRFFEGKKPVFRTWIPRSYQLP